MKKTALFVVLVLVTLAVSLGGAVEPCYACSCIMPGSPQEEMGRSSVVFQGKVTEVRGAPAGDMVNSMDPVQVIFEVSRVWKGPEYKNLVISTAMSSASCGFEFQPGQEYIVYANGGEDSLETGLCTRTRSLADGGEDIQALGDGIVPTLDNPQIQPEESGGISTQYAVLLAAAGVIVAAFVGLGVYSAWRDRQEKIRA